MTNNITYYLGAGASANAIPVVEHFNEAIEISKNRLYSLKKIKLEEMILIMKYHLMIAIKGIIIGRKLKV